MISVVELPKLVASEAEIGIQEVRIQEEDYRENQKRLDGSVPGRKGDSYSG